MGRPTVVTDDIADAIGYLYRPGVSVRKLHAELGQAGLGVSQATVARYLARLKSAPRAPSGAPPTGAPGTPATAAAPVDDIAQLETELRAVNNAIALILPMLATGGKSALDYQRLVSVKADLVRALVELRPRPEAEAERLAALGVAAKAELLERVRAQARVDEDLRGRVQRQKEMLEALTERIGTA